MWGAGGADVAEGASQRPVCSAVWTTQPSRHLGSISEERLRASSVNRGLASVLAVGPLLGIGEHWIDEQADREPEFTAMTSAGKSFFDPRNNEVDRSVEVG